jgi:hypothetical protein
MYVVATLIRYIYIYFFNDARGIVDVVVCGFSLKFFLLLFAEEIELGYVGDVILGVFVFKT